MSKSTPNRRQMLGGLLAAGLVLPTSAGAGGLAELIDWGSQPEALRSLRPTNPPPAAAPAQTHNRAVAPQRPAAPAVSDSQRADRQGTRYLHAISRRDNRTHRVPYFIDGQYVDDTSPEVNRVLCDWRTGQTYDMARRLLDIQWRLRAELDTNEPFFLVSAYRSPQTNAMLVANSNGGVARNSLHMRGMALDLRLQSRSVSQVSRAARRIAMGGVGTYTSSGFTHIDAGNYRTWGS